MAIASGVPTPPVYVLDGEPTINAFAAGYAPKDAVIGVTRGCIEKLTRDELQGVMAHEFSHILNGDMRLNIRLIAILHGVLMMGIIGYYMMRVGAMGGGGRRDKNNGAAIIVLTGLGFMALGFLGSFCGKLIKRAVSRQREYLADASAVQFTRNPEGFAGALMAIGRAKGSSVLRSPNAPSVSHMFFSEGVSAFGGMFATHPPLEDRIKRVLPNWDGDWGEDPVVAAPDIPKDPDVDREEAKRKLVQTAAVLGGLAVGSEGGQVPVNPPAQMSAIDSIGELTPEHVAYAQELLTLIPEALSAAAHETYSARAVMYALLLSHDDAVRAVQMERLEADLDTSVCKLTKEIFGAAVQMDRRATLPLVDICVSSLRGMSPSQYMAFMEDVTHLIEADDAVDLFEWTIQRILKSSLEAVYVDARPARIHHYSMAAVVESCSVLLSAVARVGAGDETAMRDAFTKGAAYLGDDAVTFLSDDAFGLDPLESALDDLVRCTPKMKRQILSACAATIAADQEVTVHEGEMLRAISEALDCPMPPLLPGQPLV